MIRALFRVKERLGFRRGFSLRVGIFFFSFFNDIDIFIIMWKIDQ